MSADRSIPRPGAVRHLVAVTSVADLGEKRGDTIEIVLDPGWVAIGEDRADRISVRSLLGPVAHVIDVPGEALDRIDAWAAETALPERLAVEDTTYWFRLRETMWRWLHERLLWDHAFRSLGLDWNGLRVDVPADEEALADVARAFGATVGGDAVADDHDASGSGPRLAPWVRALRRRLPGGTGPEAAPVAPSRKAAMLELREDGLSKRVARLMDAPGRRILVLTTPAIFQRVGAVADAPRDPNLGALIERLTAAGDRPVLIGLGLDAKRDEDWLAIESDEAMLPFSMLRSRWGDDADEERASAAAARVEAALAELPITTAFATDGDDLGQAAAAHLRALALRLVRNDVRQRACIERLLADLRPAAIVMTHEGIRLPWLAAARASQIPVFAVQHGVLYARHPGYPNERHPRLVLPTRTFVFGDFERRVLVDELAYESSEVEAVGSPRLELDAQVTLPGDVERDAIRRRLNVAEGDRLLVVSTLHLRVIQRSNLAHMLERLLGGPLPRVHLVFKQHPGERDEGYYQALLHGLAAAGGYEPPPISVVRDIDLYALLRAADAHLGLRSTVLTDAVVVGVTNLIATVDAHPELIGYREAGVAFPVSTTAELLAALDDPPAVDPERRAAFLSDHFLPGDASARIIAALDRELAGRVPSMSA